MCDVICESSYNSEQIETLRSKNSCALEALVMGRNQISVEEERYDQLEIAYDRLREENTVLALKLDDLTKENTKLFDQVHLWTIKILLDNFDSIQVTLQKESVKRDFLFQP